MLRIALTMHSGADLSLNGAEGIKCWKILMNLYTRIKTLNWLVPWPDLKKECKELLETKKRSKSLEIQWLVRMTN